MKNRNPYLVLSFILITALITLFSACAQKDEDTKQALSLIPKDSSFLFSVDLKSLSNTSLFDLLKDAPAYRELSENSGVDPEKDLDRVYIFVPQKAFAEKPGEMNAILYGRFDRKKLLAFLKNKSDVEENSYSGTDFFKISQPGKHLGWLSFLNDRCMAHAESETLLKEIIDLSQGKGESISQNEEMMALLG